MFQNIIQIMKQVIPNDSKWKRMVLSCSKKNSITKRNKIKK